MTPHSLLAAVAGTSSQGSLLATTHLVSLPLELNALSLAPDSPVAAAGEPPEASTEATTLVSLPSEILTLIHSSLLWVDSSLRSCIALEATCTQLRSALHSNARYRFISMVVGSLATARQDGSFWRWMAANGWRIDQLRLEVELHHSTAQLCTLPGVLQAGEVVVTPTVVDTLEPLRGLRNLAVFDCSHYARGAVSLEPLAGLPALREVHGRLISNSTSLGALCSMTALTKLCVSSRAIGMHELCDLTSLSKLRHLELDGFDHVSSLGPLSCLTSLTLLAILGFCSLENLEPLRNLNRLKELALQVPSLDSDISLQPLCQLTSLIGLRLKAGIYDLQPLSALSQSLQYLYLTHCVLRNWRTIGSLGTGLRYLILLSCEQRPQDDVQLLSLFTHFSRLAALTISHLTMADLASLGQQLTCLDRLVLQQTQDVTSLAPLASLTRLSFITLNYCEHISSIAPLAALPRLQWLYLLDCPLLSSLNPLTASKSLRKLGLMNCPHLESSVPACLQHLLTPVPMSAVR
jgi:hypothetical protein